MFFTDLFLSDNLVTISTSYQAGVAGNEWLLQLNQERSIHGNSFPAFRAKKLALDSKVIGPAYLVFSRRHLAFLYDVQGEKEEQFPLEHVTYVRNTESAITLLFTRDDTRNLHAALEFSTPREVEQIDGILGARSPVRLDQAVERDQQFKVSCSVTNIIAKPTKGTKCTGEMVQRQAAEPGSPRPTNVLPMSINGSEDLVCNQRVSSPSIVECEEHLLGSRSSARSPHKYVPAPIHCEDPAGSGQYTRKVPRNDSRVVALFNEIVDYAPLERLEEKRQIQKLKMADAVSARSGDTNDFQTSSYEKQNEEQNQLQEITKSFANTKFNLPQVAKNGYDRRNDDFEDCFEFHTSMASPETTFPLPTARDAGLSTVQVARWRKKLRATPRSKPAEVDCFDPQKNTGTTSGCNTDYDGLLEGAFSDQLSKDLSRTRSHSARVGECHELHAHY